MFLRKHREFAIGFWIQAAQIQWRLTWIEIQASQSRFLVIRFQRFQKLNFCFISERWSSPLKLSKLCFSFQARLASPAINQLRFRRLTVALMIELALNNNCTRRSSYALMKIRLVLVLFWIDIRLGKQLMWLRRVLINYAVFGLFEPFCAYWDSSTRGSSAIGPDNMTLSPNKKDLFVSKAYMRAKDNRNGLFHKFTMIYL